IVIGGAAVEEAVGDDLVDDLLFEILRMSVGRSESDGKDDGETECEGRHGGTSTERSMRGVSVAGKCWVIEYHRFGFVESKIILLRISEQGVMRRSGIRAENSLLGRCHFRGQGIPRLRRIVLSERFCSARDDKDESASQNVRRLRRMLYRPVLKPLALK